jgi:hypothetical protein
VPDLPGGKGQDITFAQEDPMSATTATTVRRRLPVAVRTGLVLAAVTGLADVVFNATMLSDGVTSIAGLVIGLLTLVAIPFAWRGSRGALIVVVVTRLLSGLSGLPAFFVDGVPAGGIIAAAVGLVLEVIVVILLLRPVRD